jgi:hypothetical protein
MPGTYGCVIDELEGRDGASAGAAINAVRAAHELPIAVYIAHAGALRT